MLVLIVFAVSVGSFYMIHLLPGDLATVILGVANTPANRRALYHQYGFDKNLILQYFTWFSHVIRGNLGTSYITGQSVRSTIFQALPIDFEMIFISQILAFAAAIPLAMKAARKPNGFFDRFTNGTSFALLSVPSFIVIEYLFLLVSITLQIPHTGPGGFVRFPAWGTLFSAPSSFFSIVGINLESMIIPALALAIGSSVVYFRVLRSDLISTLQEEFITMARSRGYSRRRILWRHAFRPSSVSLAGTAGVNIGTLLAGGFVVQSLLGIPGLGSTLIGAIVTQDYLLIQGIVLFVAVSVVLINFIVDFLTTIIDPRIARD